MTYLLKLVRWVTPSQLSMACIAIASIAAIGLSHLFWSWLTGAIPDGLTIVAGAAALVVSIPMVQVFVVVVYGLNDSNESLQAAEARLRERNAELAEARDDLSLLNHELEARVASRTDAMRRALDEAERANAAKSAFLANMSHELRTPLNGIIGYAEMLAEREALFAGLAPEKIDEYADAIRSSGMHLSAMVSDLLDLSKIEFGQYEKNIEQVCTRSLLDSVVDEVQHMAASRGQHIDLRGISDIPAIDSDPRAIRQIFTNILVNALKYSADGATVSVELGAMGGGIRFAVIDTGIGMSDLAISEATKPFSKFSDAHIAAGQSIGLGLSIVSRLCDLLDGRLELISAEGQGTTARVFVPDCLPHLAGEKPPLALVG